MPEAQLKPSVQTEEEIETQPQRTVNKVVDISEFYSKEALLSLKEASEYTFSSKSGAVTADHLFSVLSRKPKILGLLSSSSIVMLKEKAKEILSSKKQPEFVFSGSVFFSPELKKVLFGAYFLAKQEGATEVLDTHLFSAISALPEMSSLFSDLSFSSLGGAEKFSMPSTLGRFSSDLTSISFSPNFSFFDRERELEQMLRVLARENKHHVMLVGETGVGKTALGGGLAKLLSLQKIPSFSQARVLTLDLGALFASPTTVSYFTPKIIEEVGTLPKIIFFLEQITLLTGTQQLAMLVNFLQSMEKRGQVYFIIPSTPSFYNQFLASHPYFSSFFEVVKIEELSLGVTEKILASSAPRMEKFHKVTITPDVFSEASFLAKRYLPGTLPQKAIALLEETCASMSLAKKTQVTCEDVRKIVAQKTGIPVASLTVSEKEKLKNLENVLAQYVIGQEEAIKKVSEALRRARAGLADPKKPIGSFLFLGPTGVGKTELAKTLAKVFFDDEKAFIRLDMSEFSESHTAQRLIGSPPGYVGYEEGGQLTNPIMERPYSLILLDEIEKAHPRVFDLFLQVLDDGRLTDSRGNVVDFKNTLLIFTSNIAGEEIFARGADLVNPSFDRKKFFEETIMPIVRQYFRPEFINRFDDIVLFNPLTKAELIEIAKLKTRQLAERLKEKKINLEVSETRLAELVEASYNPSFGARPLERAIKEKIENVIAQKIIAGEIGEGETIRW